MHTYLVQVCEKYTRKPITKVYTLKADCIYTIVDMLKGIGIVIDGVTTYLDWVIVEE